MHFKVILEIDHRFILLGFQQLISCESKLRDNSLADYRAATRSGKTKKMTKVRKKWGFLTKSQEI